MAKQGHQLILSYFDSESAADAAVSALKLWDKASPDIKLGGIGILVKDDKGKIKTHKLGSRKTGTGAVLFALVALLTGGASLIGGAIVGGIVGSFFRKGLGISKDELSQIDSALNGGKAAVAVVAHIEEVASISAKLEELGGESETHAIDEAAVAEAKDDAVVAPPTAESAAAPSPELAEKVKLAAEAFLYGYPLVYSMTEIAKFPEGTSLLGVAVPYNSFGYARKLLDPKAKFVSPNNDTLYLMAVCDLRNGPLVLHAPDTYDRYYVLQFVDTWSNNFAYIGRRATGTAEASYLVAPAGYDGEVPEGMQVVHSPTGICAIVGRIAVNGEDDLPAVRALQDQFTLTPLSVFQGGAAPGPVSGVPQPEPGVSDDLLWWESFRVALSAFPPPDADAPFLKICEQLGLTAAESPYIDPDPELTNVLIAAHKAAHDKIEEMLLNVKRGPNGWQDSKHMFDYNLDFFEVGTLDSPDWKIADRKIAYVTRAIVARAGLWGNHGYEADYQIIYVDSTGQPLDSSKRYELKLPTPPPVSAFWSLTMYDVPEFYLVENPINRYSIGDRTPGLKVADDGSITLYMQKDSPGPDKESNWLPTPQSGTFRPILRMYQPGDAVLAGTYQLPAITLVE
ncbi:MAG: DUF1254 domain-containing protein [Anaerolineae bacterium]